MSQERTALNASPIGTAIDCMRGGLAIMVLLAHATDNALVRHHVSESTVPWVALTIGHGGFWVQGFFVLSGFCIHQSLMGLRRRENAWATAYTRARVSRIWPMYGIALLIALLSWAALGPYDPKQLHMAGLRWGTHFLMMEGLTGSIHELRPGWSLTNEIIYYAAWPLLLLACGWSIRRAAKLGCATAWSISLFFILLWQVFGKGNPDSSFMPLWRLPAQFILWMAGALLAESWDWWKSKWFRGLGWLSFAGLLVAYLAQGWLDWHDGPPWIEKWLNWHGVRALAMMALQYLSLIPWIGLLVGMSRWKNAGRWSRAATVLGWLSYPLYILHQPLLDIVSRKLPLLPNWGTEMLAYCAIILATVLAFGVPLEARILRWRAGWLRSHQPKTRVSEATAQGATA